MLKKCPICNSTRIKGTEESYKCEKCGYRRMPKSMSFTKASKLREGHV